MKKKSFSILAIFFALQLLLFTVACHSNTKDEILGKWQLTRVAGESLSMDEMNAFIEFSADGKLLFTIDSQKSVSHWQLSSDEKTIILSDNKNKKNWNIVALNKHQLTYTENNDTTKITLTK